MKTGRFPKLRHACRLIGIWAVSSGFSYASGPFRESCEQENKTSQAEIDRMRSCIQGTAEMAARPAPKSLPESCKPQIAVWLAAESELRRCQIELPAQITGDKK